MKRIFFILSAVIGLVCLYSCKKNPSIKAYFELSSTECQVLDPVSVNNLSTAVGTSIGLCKWEWEGQVSWETNLPSITFTQLGKQTVTLTVWPEEGVVPGNTFSRTVNVINSNEPPIADFTSPANATQDEPIALTDRSMDYTGRIVSWLWNIAGVTSTEQNPTVTLNSWGDNLDVSLTVTDNYGASNTITKKINVAKSTGHDLSLAWSRSFDDKGYVYWTAPAMSPDGSMIYVSSTGYHLVCFDTSGNEVGRYDIGKYGANATSLGTGDIANKSPAPSVAPDGKVYISVQYLDQVDNNTHLDPATDGGLFCINPGCAGEAWYFSTGHATTYRFMAAPIFGDYVSVAFQYNDPAKITENWGVFNRHTGKLVKALPCDQGSYGGVAATSDYTLVCSSSRKGAGYKVARYNGGTWTTADNSDAGRMTNFLGGNDTSLETKGFQPAISYDGKIYLCVSTGSSSQMKCACYDLAAYSGGKPTPLWQTTVTATSYQSGFGAVLDAGGNAYYMAGNKIFRLNGHDGSLAWEYSLGVDNGDGVAAIDDKGYLYVCCTKKNKLVKLSSASGQEVTSLSLDNPRGCPTIAADGTIYVTGNSNGNPTLYKVVGTGVHKTTAPGPNWSQLGANPQKSGIAPTK